MRQRLLRVLTAFATLAVLAFAIPLCLTTATNRTQQLVLGRTGDADWFATLLIARPIGTGVQVNGAVVIEAATAHARHDIVRTWGIVAGGAVAALALFMAVALVLSRWVLRPLAQLSGAVAALTATLPKPR